MARSAAQRAALRKAQAVSAAKRKARAAAGGVSAKPKRKRLRAPDPKVTARKNARSKKAIGKLIDAQEKARQKQMAKLPASAKEDIEAFARRMGGKDTAQYHEYRNKVLTKHFGTLYAGPGSRKAKQKAKRRKNAGSR